jgi:hypothetical protein
MLTKASNLLNLIANLLNPIQTFTPHCSSYWERNFCIPDEILNRIKPRTCSLSIGLPACTECVSDLDELFRLILVCVSKFACARWFVRVFWFWSFNLYA